MSLYDIVPCAVVVLVNTVPLTFHVHVAVKSFPNTALTVVLLTYTLLMRVAVTLVPLISVAVGGLSMVHCILYMLLSRSVSGGTRCILTDVDTMIKTKHNLLISIYLSKCVCVCVHYYTPAGRLSLPAGVS